MPKITKRIVEAVSSNVERQTFTWDSDPSRDPVALLSEDCSAQPERLFSAFLCSLVENGIHVGIDEQPLIHAPRDGEAGLLQSRRGRFYDGFGSGAQWFAHRYSFLVLWVEKIRNEEIGVLRCCFADCLARTPGT